MPVNNAITLISFDELVEHGITQYKESGREKELINGMPWAFTYKGLPVSHENDDCYVIASPQYVSGLLLYRDMYLVTSDAGEVWVSKPTQTSQALPDNAGCGMSPVILRVGDNPVQSSPPPAVYDGTDAGNSLKFLSFGDAMNLLLAGKRISNMDWESPDMWLTISCNQGSVKIPYDKFWSQHNLEYAKQQPNQCAEVEPCITQRTAKGTIQMGWAPSQADMFSKKWVVYKD